MGEGGGEGRKREGKGGRNGRARGSGKSQCSEEERRGERKSRRDSWDAAIEDVMKGEGERHYAATYCNE